MGLADDIRDEVKNIFKKKWETRDGTVVPDTDDVALANEAVKLKGTILYADLAQSTSMVNTNKPHFAAKIYKSYLISVCRIIREHEGEITAFDGDRVMAIFIGEHKNTLAAKTALKINWVVKNILNDELKKQYTDTSFVIKQSVGIDTSELWVARTGIRGSNDLVWVGRAANYAAKLCSFRDDTYTSWITKDVFDVMHDSSKYSSKKELMWERRTWTAYNIDVYRSSWSWSL